MEILREAYSLADSALILTRHLDVEGSLLVLESCWCLDDDRGSLFRHWHCLVEELLCHGMMIVKLASFDS